MPPGTISFVRCAWSKYARLREVCELLLAALGISVILALYHPWADDELAVKEISCAVAAKKTWVWVDARARAEYLTGHVPGAINVNEDDWEGGLQKLMSLWQPGQKVLVYCSTVRCRSSHAIALRLQRALGSPEVYVLMGGWEAWQQSQLR